ncbi:MAG: efflux RND transporter periplasmic adaptor subunit [Myxococcota bacterium]
MRVLRYVLVVVAVLAVVVGLGAVKGAQIKQLIDFGEQAERDGPPPETVSVEVSRSDTWETTLSAVGSVASSKGVAITSEVPGKVTRIRFESGDEVPAGAVIVDLDSSVEQAQLASLRSRAKLARTTLERTKKLRAGGAATQAKLDADTSALSTLEADIGALRAQIAKKIIRAPFAGRLGIRRVNLGEYLNPGQSVAELEAVEGVYVDFTLPQRKLDALKVGMPVRVKLEGQEAPPFTGKITAVDPKIDPVTRSIKLRASVDAEEAELRPGMFVDVAVVMPEKRSVVIVPATAIVRAPYGDSVFIVEDKPKEDPGLRETSDGRTVQIARQQFVRAGEARGDYVAVLEGVDPGAEVVIAGAFKLRNRSPVVVSDEVAMVPKLNPSPANR